MKNYISGNWSRTFFEGDFEDLDTAWRVLSARFNKSFPSESGRTVYMLTTTKNEFGYDVLTKCRDGVTSMVGATDEELSVVKYSTYFG